MVMWCIRDGCQVLTFTSFTKAHFTHMLAYKGICQIPESLLLGDIGVIAFFFKT